MEPLIAWLSAAAAALSALAAVASWRSAMKANATASYLLRIESDRRHAELAPRFSLKTRSAGDGSIYLTVKLKGPAPLPRIDSLTVSVRNDQQTPPVSIGVATVDEVAAVIWGPYRFRPGIDNATTDGRSVSMGALDLGNDIDLLMEPTVAPMYMESGGKSFWANRYRDSPIRLTLTCEAFGERPWVVPLEAEVPVDVRMWRRREAQLDSR